MNTNGLIDWLSVTYPLGTGLEKVLPRRLGELHWRQETGGLNGYRTRKTHDETGVQALMDGAPGMGIHTIASGEALERLRDLGISGREYAVYVLKAGGKTARIDLSLDMFDGENTVRTYAEAYEKGDLKTKAQSATHWHSIGTAGETLYIGKRTSQRMARIYDKAAESGLGGKWVRIELECKAEYARAVVVSLGHSNARDVINRAISDFIQFPNNDEYVKATSQSDAAIVLPEKPVTDTYRWLIEVAAPALARYDYEHPGEGVLRAFDIARSEYARLHYGGVQTFDND